MKISGTLKKTASSSDVNFVILFQKMALNKRRNKFVILSQDNIVYTVMLKNILPDNIWRIAVAVTSW